MTPSERFAGGTVSAAVVALVTTVHWPDEPTWFLLSSFAVVVGLALGALLTRSRWS